jgi:tetratricopeptide (TPR) repeat protein
MGYGLFCARRFEACIRTCRRALEFDPNYAGAYMYLSLAQIESGLFDEAVVTAEKAVSVNRLPVFLAILAQVYGRAGRHGNAARILIELDEVRRDRYVPSYWLAAAQLALRRKQASLRTLQKAYTERCPWLGFLKVDPSFDALRVAPACRALLRKLGQSEISVRSTGRKARNAKTRGK